MYYLQDFIDATARFSWLRFKAPSALWTSEEERGRVESTDSVGSDWCLHSVRHLLRRIADYLDYRNSLASQSAGYRTSQKSEAVREAIILVLNCKSSCWKIEYSLHRNSHYYSIDIYLTSQLLHVVVTYYIVCSELGFTSCYSSHA